MQARSNLEHHATCAADRPRFARRRRWGDPSYRTASLLSHFELRHRYDYDTTADFSQDEDAVLQQVLALSREEQ